MLKKITLLIGALAITAGSAFADAKNVVTVDMNRVIEVFSKAVAIKTEVDSDTKYAEETQKIKIDEFSKKREQLNKAVADLKTTRSNPTLSKATVAKAEADVEAFYTELAKEEQVLRQTLQETREFLQNKYTQKLNVVLQEDILPRIKEVAKARGAEIVLNARTGIIFAEPSVDITNDLLARLEKDFPTPKKKEEAPKTAETPAPAPAPAAPPAAAEKK